MMSPKAMLSLSGSRTWLRLYPTLVLKLNLFDGAKEKLPRSDPRLAEVLRFTPSSLSCSPETTTVKRLPPPLADALLLDRFPLRSALGSDITRCEMMSP